MCKPMGLSSGGLINKGNFCFPLRGFIFDQLISAFYGIVSALQCSERYHVGSVSTYPIISEKRKTDLHGRG